MNKIKSLIVAGLVLATGFLASSAVHAQTANATLCTRPDLPFSEYGGKNFTANGNKISVKVKLTGAKDCKYDLTLAVFKGYKKVDAKAPFDKYFKFDLPREDQKLFSSASTTVTGPGTYTLETTIPDCTYQADVITGKALRSEVGRSYYGYVNTDNFVNQGRIAAGTDTAHIHDATFGGDKVCEVPEVCPYDHSMPKDSKDCVPPTKTVVKTVTKNVAAPVNTVPSTGGDAGSMIASTMGLSTSTGLAYNLIRKRKLLK
jgi:hypothetical protein